MNLVKADKLDSLLRRKLEKTGFFGARFREAAGTALLLPRAGFKKRTPFWLNRLRSKKLLASVLKYEDFPILVETWRACLQDEFDIPRLTALLDEIRCGIIKVTEVRTNVPSPFSSSLIWRQTNFYMYEDDTPKSGQVSRLRPDFIKEALVSYRLRPELPPALIKSFVAKLQRTAEGYAPSSARELLDWLKERLFIPAEEWKELIAAIERDYRISGESLCEKLAGKAAVVEFPGSESSLLLALENLTRVLTCLGMELDAVKVFSLKKEPLPAALLEKLPRVRTGTSPSDAASAGVESLAQLAGEWLRYYGPLPIDRLMSGLGIKGTTREELVEILTENQSALVDIFTRSGGRLEICDTENLERMLYINRSASRPSFKALDVEFLPLFMSAYHGLTSPEDSPDGLKRCLERLFGYSLPAELWETEIFPSRLSYYQNSWIDSLMTESDLIWLGTGKGRITFCFKTDIELFNNAGTKEDRESESLFPDKRGRYGFWELAEYSGQDSSDLAAHLWRLAWKGRISNDSFAVIRKGIESRFKAVDISRQIRPGKRFGYGSWQSSRPLSGTWFMLDRASGWNDPFEREEVFRGRIQLLLERYGILFREILSHELPGWRWGDIFRSLRLMELSGEIMSGHFFKGIPGIQFIAPSALRLLNRGLEEDHVYWLNAMDPASPCGMGLEAIKGKYPARLAGNHMVFHGRKMVMSSTGLGAKLIFNVEADHPGIPRYLEFFKNLLNRRVRPPKLIRTGTINGIKALESPYRDALLNAGFSRDYRSLVLRAQYR
jgi:ATP-dependent Lhr-like helicase